MNRTIAASIAASAVVGTVWAAPAAEAATPAPVAVEVAGTPMAINTGAVDAAATATVVVRGKDRRPCVSKIEYQSVGNARGVDRDQLEDRWDVPRGLHMPQFDTRGYYVMAYKACGYNITEAQVLVRYSLYTDRVDETQRWVSRSATVHGYP